MTIAIFIGYSLMAQTNYAQNYFALPVHIPLALVGNFGELRPNHFHAGLDIRTNGEEGLPIYAVADGYVSRIKISAYGYGKAIYITHPNGYTSLYGHLRGYTSEITTAVKAIQSNRETFEVDTLLPPDYLLVTKGQQVAWSGNTGSSGGPHLHFEIRNTKTEMPINPYCFGYKVADNVAPRIEELAIFPVGKAATVNGKQSMKKIKPRYNNNHYSVIDTVYVSGEIGFGIKCWDSETGSTNHNGVYSIELQASGRKLYAHQLETFSFQNARYINSHIAYAEKEKNNDLIEKCFLSKNDKLEIYRGVEHAGIIHFSDDSIHWLKYIVKDYDGNTAEVFLKVRSSSKHTLVVNEKNSVQPFFDCFTENKFENDEVKIILPPAVLYDDINFEYSKTLDLKAPYAALHHIHTSTTALQSEYSLQLKAVKLPDSLQSKACIISISSKGKVEYEGGSYADHYVSTKTKHFGNFTIGIDATPPHLALATKSKGQAVANFAKARIIGISATDNLSGIKTYRATIDGKWVLCEYEPRKNLLYYIFDDALKSGEHSFRIEVADDKQNTSVLSFKFKR